jgi:large repetitive protein
LLPAGLTLNSNGSFSGAPTQSGTFNFRITATGFGSCTAFRDYVMIVECLEITVTPSSLPGGTVGSSYSQAVSASPSGSYSFSVSSGALPPGLSLNAASGAITGIPTTTGSFTFTITATAGSCSGSRTYTVAIDCSTITLGPASPLPSGQAGVAYSQTISASPPGAYTFSLISGSLPGGLTLNPTTGVISGTTTVTGTYNFTIKAQTASGCNGTQAYVLVINCPTVVISPASLPNGTTGTAYSQTLSASPAGGNYTYAVTSGTPPTGLNLNPSTGILSGTPTANGTFTFTVTATGFGGCTGFSDYTVVIGGGGCPTITLPASLPNGSVGQLYNDSVAASPSGLYDYAVTSGSLPPGVTLYTNIGLLYGYPTTAGSYTFTITATQGACSGSQEYTVLIGAGFASSLTAFSDFDGDGKSDLSVFRGSDGKWLVANSGNGQLQTTPWGAAYAPYNDLAVSGDYDGDGKTDLAVFRRGGEYAGYWFIKRSSDVSGACRQIFRCRAITMRMGRPTSLSGAVRLEPGTSCAVQMEFKKAFSGGLR